METRYSRRTVLAACGAALPLAAATLRGQHPPAKPIKIGQIGVGHAHATKLSVYRDNPDYEVVGIVEPDERLRRAAASQPAYHGLRWLSEEELLATPGLAAVLVETRVRDLLPTAERCLAAGKHIHLDKPAGESLAHYRRLLTMSEEKKLLVQMGYMFRYNPAVVLLRKLLAGGALGEVFEVHAVISKVVPPAARRELAEYPGGMMFELGCHVIDLVVGVLGRPERVHPFPRRVLPADGLVDNMLAVLEYPRATATVRSTALEVDGSARRQLTVCGTRGTLHIQPLDNPQAELVLERAFGEYAAGRHELKFPRFVRYVADAADMVRVIRGEQAHGFPPAHDLAVQETVLLASGLAVDG
jgi:predicted dehydrogenase